MSELRFYLDENVSSEVADALRTRGIDVLTTPAAGNIEAKDHEQLAFALAEERVLVTQDRDFLRLDSQGIEHSGIVYWKPQSRNIKYIIRELLRIHRDLSAEVLKNHIEFL
jgi:predicted nuclease of predicted toxin-antitoxin system